MWCESLEAYLGCVHSDGQKQSIPFIWFRLFAWIVHSFIRSIPYRLFSHSFCSICLFGIFVAILPLLCTSNTQKSGRNTNRISTCEYPASHWNIVCQFFLRKQMSMLLRTQINEAYFYWNNAYANVTRQPTTMQNGALPLRPFMQTLENCVTQLILSRLNCNQMNEEMSI